MSIWDEPLTTEEYRRRLFAAKADQRRRDAHLPFETKIEIVLALRGVSRELRTPGLEAQDSGKKSGVSDPRSPILLEAQADAADVVIF